MTQQQETMILQLRDEIVYRRRELSGLEESLRQILEQAGLPQTFKLRVEVPVIEGTKKEN